MLVVKTTCQCQRHKRCGFDPWVRKIPWSRAWQPTSVFLPWESYGKKLGRLHSVVWEKVGNDWSNLVQFSRSVVSDSLQPHGLQHARFPCPSPIPGACSNSCPLSWWCHPTVSSSVTPLSSYPQFFSASGFFPMKKPFSSGGQSIGASVSTSVLPMNIQG